MISTFAANRTPTFGHKLHQSFIHNRARANDGAWDPLPELEGDDMERLPKTEELAALCGVGAALEVIRERDV